MPADKKNLKNNNKKRFSSKDVVNLENGLPG